MNDDDDSPYSYQGYRSYKRPYLDEDDDPDYYYSTGKSDPKSGSNTLQNYLNDDEFNLDTIADVYIPQSAPEKDEMDDSWEEDYDPWDLSGEEEEEDIDTTMLGGDFHFGSEAKGKLESKSVNQDILEWAKDRPGVNKGSSPSSSDKDEDVQKDASEKMKQKVFEKLDGAFNSRSKVFKLPPPNILDPLPPVTSLSDKRLFEPTTRVQFTRSRADTIYSRLMKGDVRDPDTIVGQDLLDQIGFEELCELIDIDVDPESEAGEFLQELHETYVSIIDDIMIVVGTLDQTKLIPYEEIVFNDPRTYFVAKKYKDLISSKSQDEIENLAFEFIGDEDAQYVEKIAEAIFESLNKMFKKASGWGSLPEDDF
jgi:hypothetical protein